MALVLALSTTSQLNHISSDGFFRIAQRKRKGDGIQFTGRT